MSGQVYKGTPTGGNDFRACCVVHDVLLPVVLSLPCISITKRGSLGVPIAVVYS